MKQPNFGSAFDLSTLKKAVVTSETNQTIPGVEATVDRKSTRLNSSH